MKYLLRIALYGYACLFLILLFDTYEISIAIKDTIQTIVAKKYTPPHNQTIHLNQGDIHLIHHPAIAFKGEVICNDTPVLWTSQAQQMILFVVSASYNNTNTYTCVIDDTTTYTIVINKVEFDKETINTSLQKFYSTQQQRDQIAKDTALIKKAYSVSHNLFPYDTFISPVTPPIITSGFGYTRVYKSGESSVHNGIDFKGKVGTPIHATHKGRVALAEKLVLCGNTVIIDHGLDVFSVYCHLTDIQTNKGDIVSQNEVIGTLGSTGLATGPHLHFAIKHKDTWVNPNHILSLFNN